MSTLSNPIADLSPEQLAKLRYGLKASKARKQEEIPRRAPGEPCPLSFAQQRLWFIAQLEPDNPFYNSMEALRLTGKLNLTVIEQTFSELVRRHEILRTTFDLVDGEPAQLVSSEFKLKLRVIDLESLPESEREKQAAKLFSAEVLRPFDLTRGPLLRVLVLRFSEHEHMIVFATHHLITDGWSKDVLVREVVALYSAFAEGSPSPLAELPAQYADFAIWQRQRLTGPVLQRHLDYWKRHLADAPHTLALPTDHPRPAVPTRRGAHGVSTLSPELTHSLRVLSRRQGVTLFMTLLAAFDVLLSRYSGQTDFLIGTDIANRQGTTEALIGFFVNQLVLRVDLAGDPTFNELLGRVKEVTLNGYAHQEAPFERVVEMLSPERNLSHAPLFQVKLVLQNTSTNHGELPKLTLGVVQQEKPVAKFDLMLAAYESDQIDLFLEYATDLFEASTISRMLSQFERILASAVRDPEQHISQLELLSSADRHQLLVERNATSIPYPHTRGIHELFEEQVASSPSAPALTYQGQHLSYAELNSRANQLAHYLRELGVTAETPVGVCVHRSSELIVAVIAILKAGGVYVPLDPEYPAERLAFILEDLSPPIILTDSSLVDEMPASWAQTLCLDSDNDLWATSPDTNLAAGISDSNSLAYVMYTSGSTGNPKGVAVPHRAVVRLVKQSAYVDFGPGEVFLQLAPVTFDASTLEIWGALLNGGRLVLMPPGALSLPELGTVLRNERVTVLWLTAGLFHLMVEQELEALAGVSQVVAGGDVLSVEHVPRLLRAKGGNGVVVNGYGPTETTTFACCYRMSDETGLEHGVPIGSPIANTQVYVLGEKMELVGPGMVGELYIGGDGLARGYCNQPELTAERFVPHPFSTAGGERLYRTGDRVRWRAERTLEFLGRVDTQVKIRGFRVEPGEVEVVLARHGAVKECAVVTRRENGEKRLVAYVVNGNHENTSELREYLRERLPEFMLPAAIVKLESLPLTPNGKVDRRELAAREVEIVREHSYVPPSTITEELLCSVWAEVLRAERVGIYDNFFDLGGDSILTIQVIVKARALGLELTVQQLFQHQTIYALAQVLQLSDKSAEVPQTEPFSLIGEADRLRLPAGVVDAYPLTALQVGMLFHSELAPEAGVYHDIFSFHLRLPFDGEALQATLQHLIDLHPVLRTSFNLSDFSEPLQLVHQEVVAPLRVGDLRGLSPTEQDEYLAQWLGEEKRHPVDWRQAPLLRFQIDRRSEESFQFSFSFHHAILDGWSVATMLTELFKLYSVLQTGGDASEAPLSATFRDFVAAERAILESDEARQYWSAMLDDSTRTRLPRLSAASPTRVAARNVNLSPELLAELKEFARTAGVPLKSVLLAAHLRVLSLLSGNDDVITGVVSHGRPETKDSKRVLGLFLNTLPFRQKLSGGTWLDLVQQTFRAERELLPFRRYPMARVQQDVGSGAPLFEVIFNFLHYHVYEELQNVSGVEVLGHHGSADTNYTLAVDFKLMSGGAGIMLGLEYDAGQLSDSQIEAATHYYLTTLENMVHTPTARYEQHWLLSQEECRTILHEWNEPAPPELYSECYHHLFEAQVARTPNALAAVLGLEQLTYEELNQRANQLAYYLRGLGVGAEVPVGILLDRSLESIVTLLAILKAGGVYVPLNKQQPLERQQYVVADAGLTLLLTHTKFKDLLPSGVRAIYLDLERHAIAEQSTENVASAVDPSNLAYVIYTSGSTGRPKGVGVSHEVIVSHCFDIKDHYELQPHDRVLAFTSFSFDVSLEEILPTLLVGASLVVRDESVWTPKEFVQALAEQQLTVINLPTPYWHNLTQDCVAAGDFDTTYDLRLACIGNEAVLPETVRLWQSSAMRSVRLLDLCGPTETVITATSFDVPTPLPDAFPLPTIPIGRPLGTRTAYILDQHGNPVPVGVPGELHVGGPVLARGYLNRPDLTAEKFIPDGFSDQSGARLYRTGDLARYLADGNIEFLGRIDQQVKLRGFRIELGEIEAVLKQHESVREAVVVLHEAQRLIGYVQLRGEVEASELRAYLKERLPEYMVPAGFVEVAEFAVTAGGKINRRVLPAPDGIFAEATEYEAPRTPTEELLAGLWASVLRVERVGRNDNFFELGGHSLLATQLVSRVRETFGVELPLRELFERPTVAGLAEQIEAALRAGVGLTAPPLVPVSREQQLPLSFAQQRLWFLDQLEPSGSFYNQPAAVRLHGVLNVAVLEQALSEVVRRHEALRTTFVAVGGEPQQVINPFTPVTLPVFDVSELDTAEREAETHRLLGEEVSRPFDLARGPLVRACLVRLAAEEHVALVTMHHIISDGWSRGIFIREVGALYKAFLAEEQSPLAELPIQYADFTHWQRGWLQGEVLVAQLDYWREALADMPGVLELPTDRPRPPEQTFNGATVSLEVSAELTSQLKALSRRERVTLFMTLLAAFQSLLFRYSGQDDIVVGTPIANRRYRELEDLIGFFVNSLALRARSLKTLTFTELLQRVREVTLAAYAHQDLPFEKLVEELQPERDLSCNPIFQVMFALQNAPLGELELPGLTLQEQELESHTTRFDLECHLWEAGEALRGVFIYNTDLFDRPTIQRIVANFETLLHSIAANPGEAVGSLHLLSADDERQLLSWNETFAEFPQEVVHELFEGQVERTPDHTAVVFEDVSLTFLELNRRSNQLAAHLQRMGVGADTVVGVMLERSVEMLVAVLGVLKAGGAYLPLDPEYPAERLQFMLTDAAVRQLLTQERLAHNIDADVQIIRLDAGDIEGDASGAQAEANPRAAVTGDNLAYVIYTSGSTGKPKGVAMTHRPLANLVSWEVRRVGAPLRSSQFASLSFDVSFQEIFTTLCSGGTLVLIPEEKRRDAKQLLDLVIDQKLERLCVPFVVLNYLASVAEAEGKWPTSLRQVMSAGEQLKITSPIRRLFENTPGCTLDNQCGPSETHAVAGFLLPESVRDWTALPPIGRPLSNVRLYVLDKHMRPVPAGVPGTLYIAGNCVSRGYLNRPDLTADRFVPNPFSERGERLYRSGDIVRYLPAGDVEWLRREDDQVKIRGFRVELGEIETALMEQESVREAVAIARVESRGEKRLVAYVVGESGVEVNVGELRQALRAQLPEYMVPSAIVVLDELPLTPSGKINRRALPALEGLGRGEEYQAPRRPTEELLAGVWANVLRVERVGVNDNFFELGGHSLLATQLMSRVREAFAVELPLRELFARPTVGGLAEAVEAALRGGVRATALPLVPVSREQELPLSHAQERLWFLDQLAPGRATYNIPVAVRLQGELDVAALEQTLNEVVRRHEVLRTTFVAVQGRPVQVIVPAGEWQLPVLDLSALPEEQRKTEARRLAEAEAAQPFDLRSGPLVRVQLLRLAAADHVLLFTLHHIVTDGWSTGILVREVAALYEAYKEGREPSLPELAIQYADYAVWQREWLQGEVLEQQLTYWRQQLGGELPVLQLPTDKPRPPVPSNRGRSVSFSLPAELTTELKQLSNAEHVTLYMTLLAAFKLLLWRYSGQNEVVVGTPIAGRNHLATEGLIGLFVNTLVLRTSLAGYPSFRELLGRVREMTLGAYAHQDLPFEKLVEELQPERDMSRSPLFQVVFMLQNATSDTLQLPGLEASEITGGDETAKFDLTLGLSESNGQLVGALQYSTDLFEAATIERLVQHYAVLLAEVVNHPERQLSQLPLLLDEERQKLVEWSDTQRAYEHETCVHQLFEEQVRQTPGAVAVAFEDTGLTYAELNARANQLARYLPRHGVGLESRVGLCLERSLDLMVAMLAVLKAGAAYVPLDPQYPAERLQYMLADAHAPLLVTHKALTATLPDYQGATLFLDEQWEQISREDDANLTTVTPHPDNIAYVIYTSGSTGKPKGVVVQHRSLLNLIGWHREAFEITAADRATQLASLSFDAAVWEVWPYLSAGASLHLLPHAAALTPEQLRDWLLQREITICFLPTPLAETVLELEWSSETPLRMLLVGGDKLHRYEQRDLPFVVVNNYGPTESTVVATSIEVQEAESETGDPSIGRPIANTQIYLVDQELLLSPIGVTGELCIGGQGLARGYVDLPAVTAERFIPNPFSAEPGARLYRTGDLARYRADGQLEFLGRADSQVKLRGYRIELAEIEAVLREHQQVRAAVVTLSDKRLVAYVVSDAEAGDLREYLRAQLPDYMVPSFFVSLPELPLTASGKINRRALPAPEGMFEAEAEAPRTPREELLCGLWASVLRVNKVGINDDFFELGGHSLLAIQLISRIRDAFSLELPLSELFEHRTVAELAQSVDKLMCAGHQLVVPPLRPAVREDLLPLSFAQQRLWFLDQLAPENIAYNMAEALRLRGELNVAALEQSINEVIRRHEALRTTFPDVDGNPIQVVSPFRHLTLPVIDLRSLPDEDREIQAVRLASTEAQRPFNLQSGPLMRATLLLLGAEDHVLLFSMHHIISDAWSNGILMQEVTALYNAFATGARSPFADLAIQYADFAVWQRQWLSGDVLARQLDYWTAKLQGIPPLLALPTDYPRPKVQLYEGAFSTLLLSAELTAELKSLAQHAGATMYMTMLAAFHALLHRYTQQTTIVTGTPTANRTRVETEPLIGFFINTLALRSDFDDDPTFLTHLKRLRKSALDAYTYQNLPFESLVDELRLARDLSYNPLFQVMFTWEEAAWSELTLTGLELGRVEVENQTSQFDLTFNVNEPERGRLSCSMRYNTALFTEETVNRMLGHYEQLLQSIVREPEQRVSQLALLSDKEREQLLREWNDTAAFYETDVTLSELFEWQVGRDAAAIAVVSGAKEVTYGELNERANRVARHLRKLDVGAESRVALLVERDIELVAGLLGILKAGATYLPLDASYPRARLEYMLSDAAVSVVLTQRSLQSLATEIAPSASMVLCLDEAWATQESGANLPTITGSENLAYIMYTSGSTGQPKGVMISHQNVSNLFTSIDERLLNEGAGTWLAATSASFDVSVVELLWTLTRGFRIVMQKDRHQILSEHTAALDESLAAQLERHRVTHFQSTPSLAQTLLVDPTTRAALGSLRHWVVMGEALSSELAIEIRSTIAGQLHNFYGPTETTIYSSGNSVTIGNQTMPIGKPLANTELYLLDRYFEPVPVGVPGEIFIGGVGTGRGYWQRPDLTADRFLPDVFGKRHGRRLYRTGDLARYLPDGSIEFLGRLDQQVKLRGFRIELAEIEAVLEQHTSVGEAVVVVQNAAGGEQRLVAFVQLRADAQSGANELRMYLKERLPEYMVPGNFVEVAEFALTPNGKIDRRALPAVQSATARDEYEAPRTTTEELLTGLWSSVLHVNRVGVNDNFFELGGHSLLAIQLISRIRDTFGRQIAVRHLFEQPTPARLAQVVDEALRDTQQPSLPKLSPVSRDMNLPLSFAQRRLWLLDQLEANGNAYNLSGGLRFRGPLNIAAIEQALAEVIRRHEALRTTFVTRNGQPQQVIADANPVLVPIVDLTLMDEGERVASVQKLGLEEARRRFDLSRDPLLRVCLFRLSDDDHVGLFTMHHIVSDAWSMNLLLNELTTLYTTFSRGEPSPLTELSIQYPDFAVWQQTYLTGEPLAEQLNYWKQQLAGAPALLNLPVDRPRPPTQSYRGAQETLSLSSEMSAGVNELCRRENVTPFMVLVASFKLLLSWYAGQDDIVVGAPIAGRNQVETEALVGFFVNTLVLRTKLNGNPNFREVLRRVRETALGAYAHQDIPFEMLVETVAPQRNAAHSPLFQVVVGLQNIPLAPETNGDLTFELFERPVETTHYDLEVAIIQRAQGGLATLTYNTGLFEATTIRRMLNLWQALLDHLLANCDADVRTIFEYLDELDRQQQLSAAVEFRENTRQQLQNVKRRVLTQTRPGT